MLKTAPWILPVSVLCGLQSVLFLFLFEVSLRTWRENNLLIWALPLAGLLTVYVYRRWGRECLNTTMILRGMSEPEPQISPHAAPFIIFFTCLSQVCGASTGREGSAVQFGAATADAVFHLARRWLPKDFASREFLLRAGIAAGFGAVFAVPWAGGIFAWEIRAHRSRLTWLPWLWASSFLSHLVCRWIFPHALFAYPQLERAQTPSVLLIVSLALIAGVFARLFVLAFHQGEKFFRKVGDYFGVLLGTGAVAAITLLTNTRRYNDLGTGLIQDSYTGGTLGWIDVPMKMVMTILSAASGLRGGEVTPILSIGAMTGHLWGPSPSAFLTSIGLTTLFAATIGVRLTATIMAFEFFGAQAALPALAAAIIADRLAGKKKLYHL